MNVKTLPARFKADDSEAGTFEAVVATYDVDLVGDRIKPGAFKATLERWAEKDGPIPVLWSHQSQDPDYHIGWVEEAKETDEGLWVKARLDLESPKAMQVHRLLKGRRVTTFSFAYDIVKAKALEDDDEGAVQELEELELHEVGPTMYPANPATELVDAKGLQVLVSEVKAGRVLSRKNEEALRRAHEAIGSVLSALEAPSEDESGKAKPSPAKSEEPPEAKLEEPRMSPAGVRLLAELTSLGLT